MNIGKNAVVVTVVLSSLAAIGGIGFGYQEFRKAEMHATCQGLSYEVEQIQQLPQAEQMGKIARLDSSKLSKCIATAKAVPFRNAETDANIADLERIALYMPLIQGLAGGIEGFAQSATSPSAAAQPVAATVAATSVVSNFSPATVSVANFDALLPCDQLDAVAKSGKSVSEFLVSAARVNDLAKYRTAIGSTCSWNAEQLAVADRVLNPPVVVTEPARPSGRSASGNTVIIRPAAPAPRWNNCNGVQESGESYSSRCETAQELNNAGLGNEWSNRVDNRPRHLERPANGYSNN